MTYALDILEVELESPHFVHEISDSILAYVFVRCTLNLTLEIVKIVFEIILPKKERKVRTLIVEMRTLIVDRY